jgi:ABC-2 type transport system permease protein
MIYKLLVIARNTLIETLRQPVYAIILVAAMLMFIISPALSMYTVGEGEDNRLLRELGLSTLFLSGLFIAVFAAAGAIGQEIEDKTVATVLTKPVPRSVFIAGKFLGLAGALAIAQYLCAIAMMFMVRNGVLEGETDTHDIPVIVIAAITILGTLLISAFLNYFYDWKFSATGVVVAAIFVTLGMAFLYFIDPSWKFDPAHNGFTSFDVYASILLFMGALTILSVAVALSTRFNILVTLACCIGVFMLGLISDYIYGQLADKHSWAIVGRAVVPSLQVFWVSDAILEGTTVTAGYVASVGVYTACFSGAMLLIAIGLFQKRQIG